VKFFETAATTVPTKKRTIEIKIIGLRPNMLEKDVKLGWKTGRE
jgi:hypothetical protein